MPINKTKTKPVVSYIDEVTHKELCEMSLETRLSVSEIIRVALDFILQSYSDDPDFYNTIKREK